MKEIYWEDLAILLSYFWFYVNIDKYGNTSSASVLLALHEALGESKIKKGDNILFSVFGAGFAWGSAVVRW